MRERGSQAGGCGGGFWERLGAGGVNVRWVDGAGLEITSWLVADRECAGAVLATDVG